MMIDNAIFDEDVKQNLISGPFLLFRYREYDREAMVDIDKLRPDLDKLRRPQNAIKLFEFVSPQNRLSNVIMYCQLCQLLFTVLALSSK